MVAAIAFESIVKLVAFLAGRHLRHLRALQADSATCSPRAGRSGRSAPLLTPLDGVAGELCELGVAHRSCRCRDHVPAAQFQVTVIENKDEKHLQRRSGCFRCT
jgi:hypothetical protein